MKEEGRVTPWYSWHEWKHVKNLLFSFHDPDSQLEGVHFVAMWKSNVRLGTLPISVDLTSSLIDVYLKNKIDLDESNYESLRLSTAMILVRFINGITDQLQTGEYAQSVQIIAEKLDIPDWLVDLRHESTHSVLPSMDVLKSGVMFSLSWLQKNYWDETESNLQKYEAEIFNTIQSYFKEYRDIVRKVLTNYFNKEKEKEKKKFLRTNMELLKSITQNLSKFCNVSHSELLSEAFAHSFLVLFNADSMQTLFNSSLIRETDKLNDAIIDKLVFLAKLFQPQLNFFHTKFPCSMEYIVSRFKALFDKQYYLHLNKKFAILTFFFIMAHLKVTYLKPILKFFLEKPSTVSFQLLDTIIQENEFSSDFKSLWLSFQKVFTKVVDFVRCNETILETEMFPLLSSDEIEILSNLKKDSKKFDTKKKLDITNSKWTLLSEKELSSLPEIGYLDDIPCTSEYKFDQFSTEEVRTKDFLHSLFLANVEDLEDTKTEEYRLQRNSKWRLIDFQVCPEETDKLQETNNYALQNADIQWF